MRLVADREAEIMSGRAPRRKTFGYAGLLAAAGLLVGGWQAAANPTGAPPNPASNYAAGPVQTCSKTASGQVADCPRPIPRSLLPAMIKNNGLISRTPSDLARFVDTRTWTSGGGNTFPGADAPYGMVQWSPDTLPGRVDGGGYTYGDRKLDGYSLTHMSGPGCAAAGDVPILPMTGELPPGNPSGVTTPFSNVGEVAQAGYYSARSNMPQTITSSFTATQHAAIASFKFPKTRAADFLFKLRGSQEGVFASHVTVIGNNQVEGWVTSGGFCHELSSKVGPQRYTVYFDVTFNRSFTAHRIIYEPHQPDPNSLLVTFSTTRNQVIDAKVGISYVRWQNARLNWQTEIPDWDFAATEAATQNLWNGLLGELQVSGGSAAVTQEFYSLLYKDFLEPSITSDVNGEYFGSDWKVHTLSPGQQNQYGMFSGWDIYHSLAQLQAMLDPIDTSDMAQSLVNYYQQNHILPQWGYLNLDNYAQNGDPSAAIIADYYAFGASSFDTTTALTDMLRQADTVNHVRPGERYESRYGYLPQNGSYPCCDLKDYASSLLEYDTADMALSEYASAKGDNSAATELRKRANSWTNLFDKSNDLLIGKFENHRFLPGVTATTTTRYLEGDAYEYLWDVPNNYAGLFARLGGKARVRPELRRYLSQPNGLGLHPFFANEFDLGEQFAPDYAGDPAETQRVVNNIRRNLYRPGPFGIDNNDDLGAESSQFIWEMLGMYPENPGSGNLVLASPGFPRAVINLPYGSTITINAPGAANKIYVRSLSISGTPQRKLYVPFNSLSGGAMLNWSLSAQPTSWGTAPADAPPSYYG
jgi:predicted alpha-1,2-mannosidase